MNIGKIDLSNLWHVLFWGVWGVYIYVLGQILMMDSPLLTRIEFTAIPSWIAVKILKYISKKTDAPLINEGAH